MSLSQLSPKSLEKVFTCLDLQFEPGTIALLRRTSFELNNLAKTTEFDKINALEVRLHLIRSRNRLNLRRTVVTDTVVTLVQKMTNESKHTIKCLDFSSPPFSSIQYNDAAAIADILPFGYGIDLLRRFNNGLVQKQTYKDDAEKDAAIFKMLAEALAKVRSFSMFSLFEIKLDSGFLSKLKELFLTLSRNKTTVLNIQRCQINLTTEELTELLDLFPNTKSICLDGTFREAIVTDEHLTRASKSFRLIHDAPITKNVVERDFYPCPTFSGITKVSLSERNGKYPKSIILDGFYSNITFTAMWDIMQNSLQPTPVLPNRPRINSTMYIEVLSGSDELIREIAKAQRKRQFRWNLYRTTRRTRIYQVYSKNSSILITFAVAEPRKDPEFNRLLNNVVQLRHQLNNSTVQEAGKMRRQVMSKVTEVNWDLYEYEWTHKLTDAQMSGGELRMLNDEYRESFHILLNQMRKAIELDGKTDSTLFACTKPIMFKVDRMMDFMDTVEDDVIILDEDNGAAIDFMDVDEENEALANLENEMAEHLNNQLDDMLDRANILGDLIPDRHRNLEQQKLRMLTNLNNVVRKLEYRIAQLEPKEEAAK